ncbi:MAG: NAD(P)-binding protein [Verrucomicrobia bacterium]|jgi:NADPH-dependent glutamate synthase beta subunit-like oxidoreductase|nr:NAD(P)-binding protein [Verrucomicrobiota bacterium]
MSTTTAVQIDGRQLSVPKGTSLLDAAVSTGIAIPTMCYRSDLKPYTSCMLCLVANDADGKLHPACSTRAEDGMSIRTETDDVQDARTTALELLLSEHVGDCNGPCQRFCPAGMDIPTMLKQIADGQFEQALRTVKHHIALPATLGRICPAPCEKGCRRTKHDGAVSICLLKRFVADRDLFSKTPWQPKCKPTSGKHVAIVGTGPAGLGAAYELLQQGHACTLIDSANKPGGELRKSICPTGLPEGVLDQEIGLIHDLGANFRMNSHISEKGGIASLLATFDTVILATGPNSVVPGDLFDVAITERGIEVDDQGRTSQDRVYACGSAVRPVRIAIRALADGRMTALTVDHDLVSPETPSPRPHFDSSIRDIQPAETAALAAQASPIDRTSPSDAEAGGYTAEEAAREAARCMHCECAKAEACLLREHATSYQPLQRHYPTGERVPLQRVRQQGGLVFEPGKCIKCGICVRITEREGEALGLTFIGRGFDIRIGVPFERSLEDGLQQVAEMCVEACPTGALA